VLLRQSHAEYRVLFPLLDQCPGIVLETSYLGGHDGLSLMVERWGAERLAFGTGLPLFEPGLPITALTYSGLTPAQQQMVGSGTVEHLLAGCMLD